MSIYRLALEEWHKSPLLRRNTTPADIVKEMKMGDKELAIEAAKEAVANGFFATWSVPDDEPPYWGDDLAALNGVVWGDQKTSAVEPFPADLEGCEDVEEFITEYRSELYRLGLVELKIESE